MKLINDYEKALQAIYDHVGFKEDWVIYPIADCTSYVWEILGSNSASLSIHYANSLPQLKDKGKGDYYDAEIYTQRFYDKWVYEDKDFTLVFTNPGTDGMKYFALFDNKKQIK